MAHGDITHIDIPVADMAAATAFYERLFGWQIREAPGFEVYPMWLHAAAVLRRGGFDRRDCRVGDGCRWRRLDVEAADR